MIPLQVPFQIIREVLRSSVSELIWKELIDYKRVTSAQFSADSECIVSFVPHQRDQLENGRVCCGEVGAV